MRRLLLVAAVATGAVALAATEPDGYRAFRTPQRVAIDGYEGDAMEPFVTRDGRYLLFNNSNDPRADTNLHWAERLEALRFRHRGEIPLVNSPALDGVPTVARDGTLYFVSTRSYDKTLSTVYVTALDDAGAVGVALVDGVSPRVPGIVVFDVEVSSDGETLLIVDGRFTAGSPLPRTADFVIAHRRGRAFERDPASHAFASINTGALEYAAALSADTRELFFTRADLERGIAPRLYRSVRKQAGEAFGQPQLVHAAAGFVEAPAFAPDERSLYFHRRDDERFAIYRMSR